MKKQKENKRKKKKKKYENRLVVAITPTRQQGQLL